MHQRIAVGITRGGGDGACQTWSFLGSERRPPSFCGETWAWAQVLEGRRPRSPGPGPAVPPWRFWAAGFAFLAGILEWAQRVQEEDWSPYVASSRARDLVEGHARPLRQARPNVPGSNSARGAEYLLELEDLVRRVQAWTNEGLEAGGF